MFFFFTVQNAKIINLKSYNKEKLQITLHN